MTILYSTGCPRCKILKQKLDKEGIPYTENNSAVEMLKLGIDQVPVLSVDGKQLGFSAAVKWASQYSA